MTATQEEIAAAWSAWQSRHGGKLGPGPAFVEAINAALALRLPTLESLQSENEELRDLTAHLRLQAQTHAMEARGANATINEIYQIISGGKGEPANYHGAEPVRKYVEAVKGEILRLETELALSKPVYSRRQLEARAEAAEAEVKHLRERLKPFSEFAGVLFERNFNRTDSVAEMTDVDNIPHVIFAGSFFDARTALASTGGEHHAE